jgi:NAD+ kinase
MILGIIPNIYKPEIINVLSGIINDLNFHKMKFYVSKSLLKHRGDLKNIISESSLIEDEELIKKSDMVISIGGDGTMLHTAYEVRNYSTPILGVNIGKLGFLAEFDLNSFGEFINEIKENNYIIEERMALVGFVNEESDGKLYAINDIVIDKGPWQKMIELTVKVDDDYVTTFSADGIILATPTGSTGYSLSTGGPILSPSADVIVLSPIAPHTLTMRPLVISSNQKTSIIVNSPHEKIQVSCDGQRVFTFPSQTKIDIEKSNKPVRLVHSSKTNYFEILRNKLYWGLDVRLANNSKEKLS